MIVCIAQICLLVAADSGSAAPHDTVLMLPEVRVERERATLDARRRLPTAFVSELAPGTAGRAFESLSEVLGEAAGVHVTQYGGLGAFSTISLRGAPPGQVMVFLDGAPLTSAAHGIVDLTDLPVAAVERVEVYRGLAPLDLGAATPGGAINLVTATSPELREARIARGAFGTWEATGSAGGRRGPFAALVHAGYQRSAGDFAYRDDNGTPYNAADDTTRTRINDAFEAASALASLAWRPGAWSVIAREEVFRKAQGVPGLEAVPAYRTHLEFVRARSVIEASAPGAGARPAARVRAGLERERTRFRDPDAELGLGRHDTDDRSASDDASVELAWERLPRGVTLVAGGGVRGERADLADHADGFPDPPASRRTTVGAHAALQWRPIGDRLVIHAADRIDRLDDRLSWNGTAGAAESDAGRITLRSPQAGIGIAVGGGVELRANWSDASRAPDFLELFGNQGSVLGHPGLLPERGRNRDFGGAWVWAGAPGEIRVESAAFVSDADNLIVYVRHSQSSASAENIARARIAGVELSARAARRRRADTFAISASCTAMRTRDEGPVPFWNGRRLPQHPDWQGDARLDWTHARWRAAIDVQAIGDNMLDRANLQPVPGRVLLGASLAWTPGAGALRFTVEGKNLGDDHVSDVGGFPLPGRALFASCDVRLGGAPSPHSR
ncbi:MAG: TonB-dependent receptor [Candidatus Eisenbacteria bacterium]|uniref:TonB-dependent receptor n=1 Tax=Eiseniibacteriota bacterium TaxID=2212470 RepID=A0A9D6L9R9_UNCEI|nr:TonB-dependent receptor [Candidatus Eisenbacteria bacterium]